MLNLEELEKKLNEILETETPLSLMAWLEMKKQEESNNGWISIKERLPKERQRVLIYKMTLQYDEYPTAIFFDKRFWLSFPSGYEEISVRFWQPLPEPPKGE